MRNARTALASFLTASLLVATVCATGGEAGVVAGDVAADANRGDRVLARLGFDADARRELAAGAVVATSLDAESSNELAIGAAMIVRRPLEEVYDALRAGRSFEVNPEVVAFGRLRDGGELDRVRYTPGEVGEVKTLLDAEAGSDFNLSAPEIARFRELGSRFRGRRARKSAAASEAVAATYRDILSRRYLAYLGGGVATIVPYAREDDGDDPSQPSAELAAAAAGAVILASSAPELHRAFADYPSGPETPAPAIEDRFYWIKQIVEDRPAFILAHRMHQRRPEVAVIAERQFYVGHTYNTLQTVTALLPTEGGTLLVYTNRTTTDGVTGFGRSVTRRIGRSRMNDAVVEHLQALRR